MTLTVTPLKMNGWNLQITQFEKENHLNHTSIVGFLPFVYFAGCIKSSKNQKTMIDLDLNQYKQKPPLWKDQFVKNLFHAWLQDEEMSTWWCSNFSLGCKVQCPLSDTKPIPMTTTTPTTPTPRTTTTSL